MTEAEYRAAAERSFTKIIEHIRDSKAMFGLWDEWCELSVEDRKEAFDQWVSRIMTEHYQRRSQIIPDETKRYADGWPVRADDRLAEAIFAAFEAEEISGVKFGELAEHQRDDYRRAAEVAREFLATEGQKRGES